jgi:hypothetical protein
MGELTECRLNVLCALDLGIIDADFAETVLGHLGEANVTAHTDLVSRIGRLRLEADWLSREIEHNCAKLRKTLNQCGSHR